MKELRPPHDPIETIGEAYELLLEKTLEEAQKVKEKTGPALHKLIDKVKTSPKIETISGVTPPSDLAASLKRDLLDAARFCDETGKSISDWLGFDESRIEENLKKLFAKAADQTTVELHKLKAAAADLEYYAGETTGPGSLVCVACGNRMQYLYPAAIVPCDQCKGTHFKRDWH